MWAQLRVELRAKAPGETPSRRVGFRAEAYWGGWMQRVVRRSRGGLVCTAEARNPTRDPARSP
jgi:hypothetical protein